MTPLEELLKQQIAALQQENQALVAKIAKLEASDLTPEHHAILKVIEPEKYRYPPDKIAERLGTETDRTHYILIQLRDWGYVGEMPAGFYITDKGRMALHNPSV